MSIHPPVMYREGNVFKLRALTIEKGIKRYRYFETWAEFHAFKNLYGTPA